MLVTQPVRVYTHRPVFRRKPVRADWNEGVRLTGKYLGLFVLFTSTTNWWFYRKIRKEKDSKD